jgi:hypothetical protein
LGQTSHFSTGAFSRDLEPHIFAALGVTTGDRVKLAAFLQLLQRVATRGAKDISLSFSHLAQRLAAMDLHRHLAQLQLMCNLLVWRPVGGAVLDRVRSRPEPRLAIPARTGAWSEIQSLRILLPARTWRYRNEYDRKRDSRFDQGPLKAARPRQSDVEYDAARRVEALSLKEVLR